MQLALEPLLLTIKSERESGKDDAKTFQDFSTSMDPRRRFQNWTRRHDRGTLETHPSESRSQDSEDAIKNFGDAWDIFELLVGNLQNPLKSTHVKGYRSNTSGMRS